MMSCHRVQANHGNQLKLAEENERLANELKALKAQIDSGISKSASAGGGGLVGGKGGAGGKTDDAKAVQDTGRLVAALRAGGH